MASWVGTRTRAGSTPGRLWERTTLNGYWGCQHLFDDFDTRDEALVVRGVTLDDHAAAKVAVEWLARQLSRPLDFQVWRKRERVVAQRWVLSDTGREVGRRGARWALRHDPTSVTRLRPAP